MIRQVNGWPVVKTTMSEVKAAQLQCRPLVNANLIEKAMERESK